MNQGTILGSQIGRWIILAALAVVLGTLLLTIRPVGAQTDGGPTIDEAPATFSHAEDDDSPVYTFRASDPEGKGIFWTLTGLDAADFEMVGTGARNERGELRFKSLPNFEMPTDREDNTATPDIDGDDNVYVVTVRFSDGGAPAGDHAVQVTVTNVEEDGMVTLSPLQPQEGSDLTATVTDSDGDIQAEYQWYKSDTEDDTPTIIDGADEMTYIPTADDVGSYLTVKARYVDGHGSAIDNAMTTATRAVRADTTANDVPVIPDQNISNMTIDTTITRFVLENMPPWTPVGPPVTAVDDNLDGLTYSLGPEGDSPSAEQITAAEPFDINPATGQITTNRALNAEAMATHNVVVTATDPDGDVVETSTIIITVSNVDEAPVFSSATSTPPRAFNVEFNVVERTRVLYRNTDPTTGAPTAAPDAEFTFTATDPDPPDGSTSTITWSLEGESEGFTIPGGMLTAPALEYVKNGDNVYELTVVAADSQYDDAKKARLSVTVKVTDADETQAPGSITIFNLQPEVGTNLFLQGTSPYVSDTDGVTGSVKWQWYSQTILECPTVTPATDDPDRDSNSMWAKITTRGTSSSYTPSDDRVLNDERTNEARDCLMVRAKYKDGGPPGVDDVLTEDHDESYQYAYAVSVNRVQAEDENNLEPMFADGDSSTGGIQTRARIPEGNGSEGTQAGAIIVSGVTAVVSPVTATTETGTAVIAIGVVEDDNAGAADNLTYTLGGPDAGDFSIVKGTGAVTIIASPDSETKDSYTFVLIATDPTNATDPQDTRPNKNGITVIVEVTDLNEDAQFTAEPTHVVYYENGTGPVAAYPASDQEDDSFIWDLSGTDAVAFGISQLDGSLKFMNTPDFEDPDDDGGNNVYEVNVLLRQESNNDGVLDNTDDMVDTAVVMVKVVDEGEAPDFTSDTITLNIDENQQPNMDRNRAVSASPQAYDDDANRVVSLHYTIDPDDGAFGIVPVTGELRTAKVLDYESGDRSFDVTVTATDPTGLSDSIAVTIEVNNVDEAPVGGGTNQAPAFAPATMDREVAENTAADTAFDEPVEATDPNTDDVITYTLGGTDAGYFDIDETTGQLMTSGALDHESQSSYTVTVTATDDDADDPLSGMTTVTITVTDVEEVGAVTLDTESPVVDGEVTATLSDLDGSISNVSWTWETSSDDAAWSAATGTVTDAVTTSTYTPVEVDAGRYLRATASYTDGYGADSAESASAMVVAADTNVAPEFPGATATRTIAENTAANTNIGAAVAATDANNDTLAYTLEGTDAASFGIDSGTGQLRTSAALDFETKDHLHRRRRGYRSGCGLSATTTEVTINVTDVVNEAQTPVERYDTNGDLEASR